MRFVKIKGIGGFVKEEKDFIVREVPRRKYFLSYQRQGGKVSSQKGDYAILKMTKRGMTTEQAIRRIADNYGIKPSDVSFGGIKDKKAITTQYISIKGFKGGGFGTKNLSVEKVGNSPYQIQVGDIEGNEFDITIREFENTRNFQRIIRFLKENGMPNYFGPQRFGMRKNNHVIGRLLVKKEFKKALILINRQGRKEYVYAGLEHVPKKRLKFYVNAYQSYLFNKTVEEFIKKKRRSAATSAHIIGRNTVLRNSVIDRIERKILRKEGIKPRNFEIKELSMSFKGGKRLLFVKPHIYKTEIKGPLIKLSFFLPSGSYATVLIRELTG